MLTKTTEYGRKIKEEMKATQSEIKQNIPGVNSEEKETGTQINNLEQKEKIRIQPENRMKKREFKKMRRD